MRKIREIRWCTFHAWKHIAYLKLINRSQETVYQNDVAYFKDFFLETKASSLSKNKKNIRDECTGKKKRIECWTLKNVNA